MLALLGMGSIVAACGSDQSCATDDECPASQRCVNSGGLFWNGGVCVATQGKSADAGPLRDGARDMKETMYSDATAPFTDTSAPSDAPAPPRDVSTNGTDSSDMNIDATPDMQGPVCECLQPDDDCASSGNRNPSQGSGVCIGEVCNIDAPCPAGYDCKDQGDEYRCECIDPLLCGVACETDADCGYSQDVALCSPADGVCLPETICLQSRHCADDELCALSRYDNGTCRASGDLPVGEPCTQHGDCATATCITNLCVTPCRRNLDCDGEQLCIQPQGSAQGACTESSSAPCIEGCPGPHRVCMSNGDCDSVEDLCEPGTCGAESKCTITRALQPPECSPGEACGPTEYALAHDDDTTWCSELDPCWEDADCQDGSCIIIHRTGVGGVTLSDVRADEYLPVCASPAS